MTSDGAAVAAESPPGQAGTRLRMNQAIAAAIADEMRADPSVVCFGEDVAQAGGVFKTSTGLLEEFGPLRVRDTPISEMAIVGAAVGAAATGLRPVVEVMFAEFYGVAFDPIVTQAAKLHYLSAGQLTVPMVSRGSVGAGRGFGATHSQTCETWFLATPGLKVAVASGARSAYGLLRGAIRDEGPVVFLEPKALYGEREHVETGDAAITPLGVAATLRRGADVTLVALGQMVVVALDAAQRLAPAIDAEVIDLQTLLPWDRDAVLESVARTGRLVIVEENPHTGGWGNEVAAHVAATLFGRLRAPVHRITNPDAPVPFARPLEMRFLPSAEYVAAQVTELLEAGTLPDPWWKEVA